MVTVPSMEVIVFDLPVKEDIGIHDAFQKFLEEREYWNNGAFLASPLEPDTLTRFSDLDTLLEGKTEVRAFPLRDGETRDWYCNNGFLGGNTAVVIYHSSMLEKTGNSLWKHRIKGSPIDSVKAVIMPSTAYAP